MREIVNDILEITACWLGWNEPVSDDNLARHETVDDLFCSGSRVACIDQTYAAAVVAATIDDVRLKRKRREDTCALPKLRKTERAVPV